MQCLRATPPVPIRPVPVLLGCPQDFLRKDGRQRPRHRPNMHNLRHLFTYRGFTGRGDASVSFHGAGLRTSGRPLAFGSRKQPGAASPLVVAAVKAPRRTELPWMLEVTKNAPQMAIMRLGQGFRKFIAAPSTPRRARRGSATDSLRPATSSKRRTPHPHPAPRPDARAGTVRFSQHHRDGAGGQRQSRRERARPSNLFSTARPSAVPLPDKS